MKYKRISCRYNYNRWLVIVLRIALWFIISPCAFGRDITFLHISDQHYGSKDFDPNILHTTIDTMNTLPGTPYPDNIPGVVGKPIGVILTGDLTNDGLPNQWKDFVADWGLAGGDGRVNYPVYEGAGNHDGPVSSADGQRGYVRRQIIQRNKKRPNVVNISENGLHYSWDWQDVHFVQLNEYAGLDDTTRYTGNPEYKRKAQSYGNPAEKSLQFLEQDLAANVGQSNRPVIICQHYGFDGFAFRPWGDEMSWWSEEHALRLWEVIEPYNVIAILAGHNGSEDIYNWNGIPNYHMDDSVLFGVYHITDKQMTVSKRNSKTNEWEPRRTQSTSINAALPSELLAGPYLVYPDNPTKMTVLWQTDSNLSCELSWGNVFFNYEAGNVTVLPYDTKNYLYKYTITDLQPNTRYVYKIKINRKNAPGMFYTAPDSNDTKVKFLAYGDTRSNISNHGSICKAIYNKLYEDAGYHTFLLHTGDFVDNGNNIKDWDNQFFSRNPNARYAKFIQSRLPIMSAIGNHEGNGILYKKLFPYPYKADRYYSSDYGPVHITVIDQYTQYTPGSAQYDWLKKDLENTKKDWKILLFHRPGFSTGNHSNNKTIQKYIQPLCETYGVDICLAGHNHCYVRADVGGVKHITTGGGGATLHNIDLDRPNVVAAAKALNFCAIEVNGDTLTLQAFDNSGKTIDSFTMKDYKGAKAGFDK